MSEMPTADDIMDMMDAGSSSGMMFDLFGDREIIRTVNGKEIPDVSETKQFLYLDRNY